MPVLRGNQFLIQRMLRPCRDRNVAASGERNNLQCVFQSLPCIDVARHNRKRFHLEFGRIQGQKDSHGIIRTGIGINDDSLRRALRKCIGHTKHRRRRNAGSTKYDIASQGAALSQSREISGSSQQDQFGGNAIRRAAVISSGRQRRDSTSTARSRYSARNLAPSSIAR